jgi:vesicle coat complex subunit
MLSSGPEVQYVALRNILLIIQRRPAVLKNDVKVFFCKYNDPIYVKLAKLEIMYRLAREENALEVLSELQEYGYWYIRLCHTDFECEDMLLKSMSTLSERLSAPLDAWLSRLTGLQTNAYKHCLTSWRPRFLMLFKKQPL